MIIIIGFKSAGKTKVGLALTKKLDWRFIDLDEMIEKLHYDQTGEILSKKNIFQQYGEKHFRQLEKETVAHLARLPKKIVVATGGGTPLDPENQKVLKRLGKIVYRKVKPEILWERLQKKELPPFIKNEEEFKKLYGERSVVYEELADYIVREEEAVEGAVEEIVKLCFC